jgi:hypothetical protein
MSMARKFFNVCAGLLMLAAAYNFGATAARAQIQNAIWSTNYFDGTAGAVVGRNIHWMDITEGGWSSGTLPPVPGSSEVVHFSVRTSGEGLVELADGSVLVLRLGSSAWQSLGNILSGPTSARTQSFGSLKAKYR